MSGISQIHRSLMMCKVMSANISSGFFHSYGARVEYSYLDVLIFSVILASRQKQGRLHAVLDSASISDHSSTWRRDICQKEWPVSLQNLG